MRQGARHLSRSTSYLQGLVLSVSRTKANRVVRTGCTSSCRAVGFRRIREDFPHQTTPLRVIAVRGKSGSEDFEESLRTIPAGRKVCCFETPHTVLAQPALHRPLQLSAALSMPCPGTNAYDHYPKIPRDLNSGTLCQIGESWVF